MSIVVLFLSGSPWIDGCLGALRRTLPESIAREVIALANGVPSTERLSLGVDVTMLRSEANLGFGGGCNWASRHARGRYLVFLNDDTVVERGWLEALVSAAESRPDLGAVGSLVVTPDGRVEEAGRVLWRDGVSHGIAEGASPDRAHLSELREVDSCSACSLLVRRDAWDAVGGGFDERYFPAYYEDSDLCLRLRSAGWMVACASGSRVRHHRSSSTSLLWRRFLGLRNHKLFVERWDDALQCFDPRPRDQPELSEISRSAEKADARRKALYDRHDVHASHEVVSLTPAQGHNDTGPRALMEQEITHLRAQLQLKEEYIAFLQQNAPHMERGLQRQVQDESRRARRRDRLRRVPLLGAAAVWVKGKLRAARSSRS